MEFVRVICVLLIGGVGARSERGTNVSQRVLLEGEIDMQYRGSRSLILFVAVAIGFLGLAAQSVAGDKVSFKDEVYARVYQVGKEIAQGVGLSLVVGIAYSDPDLKYSIESKEDVFSVAGITWPILHVIVNIESKKIGDNKITFALFLETEEGVGTIIVGTVMNIRANGKVEQVLAVMNNHMFVETEEGTREVTLVEGELYFVEAD